MKGKLSLDVFRAANTVIREPCSLAVFLKQLPADERRAVQEAIADDSIQAIAIVRVLRDRGWASGEQVISRHRRGPCKTCEHYFGRPA